VDAGRGPPEAGDLVRLVPARPDRPADERAPFAVARTERPCDPMLLGFITDPVRGGADGQKVDEHDRPLAIYGYFPVKVTVENGPIRRGDPIASSSRPGYGARALDACRIVGYALEDADRDGVIQAFAHLGEHAAPAVRALREEVRALARGNEALRAELRELRAELQALRQALARRDAAVTGPGGRR
jgi:hypothetical protein